MKSIRIFGCLILLSIVPLAYLAAKQNWPAELKIFAFIVIAVLVYIGFAAIFTKTKKSFKEFIVDVLSGAWPL